MPHHPANPSAALPAARVLALTRIVAGLVVACSADVHGAVQLANLDARLVTPPAGLAWLSYLQLPAPLVLVLVWLTVFAALLGALGAYARISFGVTSVALLVLLALPQRLGAVTHAHHLLWISLLLSASPCADVWSADAYFTPRALGRAQSYRVPLFFMQALAAAIYFFPGLHKLLGFLHGSEPGAWFASHLSWKWLQRGQSARVPFPLRPWLLTLLACAALAFELTMPVLIALRRTRLLALLAALVFHVGTAWLLFIRFDSLVVMLVPLLYLGTWPGLLELRSAQRGIIAAGGVLLSGALLTCLLGATQLYPFACYPTFAEPAPPTMPSAQVWLLHGSERCALPRPHDNPGWIKAFRIVGAYGDALTEPRARAYLRERLATTRNPNRCRLLPDTVLALHLQRLRWDIPSDQLQVVSEQPLYSASARALGMAPADGVRASSSPAR